jgi:DNA-3-methyladenine glycosylase
MKLDESFYLQENVVKLSRELLGKVLVTRFNGKTTSGIITETEAYAGINDKASHAYGGRRTERTETMYKTGGTAYVYLCYGIHHLFNVVTNQEDIPHAILIRALEPLDGISVMKKRRGLKITENNLCSGPGKLSVALGITTSHDATWLCGEKIWIEDQGIRFSQHEIETGPRIGIDYAGEDALLPYRFYTGSKSGASKTKSLHLEKK